MAYAVLDYIKIIDLRWLQKSVRIIVAKRCELEPRLLLIS